jgi:hypothetical protein
LNASPNTANRADQPQRDRPGASGQTRNIENPARKTAHEYDVTDPYPVPDDPAASRPKLLHSCAKLLDEDSIDTTFQHHNGDESNPRTKPNSSSSAC